MSSADYERLLEMLAEKSFMYSEKPTFKLASGKLSSYYVNCKKVTYDAEGINLIGKLIFKKTEKFNPDGAGGLTLGADPMAVAVAAENWRRGRHFKAFVVRKQAKEYGTKAELEGDMKKGERVVILEDVITTGESALKAVKAARDFGLEVLAVLALIDREEGGRERIEKEGVLVEALFTREKIFERYNKINEPRADS